VSVGEGVRQGECGGACERVCGGLWGKDCVEGSVEECVASGVPGVCPSAHSTVSAEDDEIGQHPLAGSTSGVVEVHNHLNTTGEPANNPLSTWEGTPSGSPWISGLQPSPGAAALRGCFLQQEGLF